MYLGHHASTAPLNNAVICAESGARTSYCDLDRQSWRFVELLRRAGMSDGDSVALLLPNSADYLALTWAALRMGWYVTPLNPYMAASEVAYVVEDCRAKVVIGSGQYSRVVAQIAPLVPSSVQLLLLDGSCAGWHSIASELPGLRGEPLANEVVGAIHCYSSGTTGKPKGVKLQRLSTPVECGVQRDAAKYAEAYRLTPSTVYFTAAPLFHSAALHFSIAVHGQGGTVVLLEHRFDPSSTLEYMARYGVTHSQWVPTMFHRLLKLPETERCRHDLSLHQLALHGAAPCSIDLKRRMIDWWGPILYEAYGCTELYGFTAIGTPDWLRHPGSVGRAVLGTIHICDSSGVEVPAGTVGNIYFAGEQARSFSYTNDPERTKAARHPLHEDWATVGDIGYVDPEGYLYLTDRKDFLIISGGVNISPQAVEDALAAHPQVDDVAVIGVPDDEMGEVVKAVVQLQPGCEGSDELARVLIEYAGSRISRHMVPRSVDFVPKLPRLPNGKLYKRLLKNRYWPAGVPSSA
jgi:long-chain acyl-CoA synthetase